MHRLLKMQLKKIGYANKELTSEQTHKLINLVDRAYIESDEDREFLEHTLEVSSREMHELYEELERKSASKLAQSEARFRALAQHDTLTGISNRFALENELHRLISRYRRKNKKFALLFLDLDHFKKINDSYGHDFGDKLLQEVVARIAPKLRAEDIFARIAGDEFVIVFTDISENSLSVMIEKILIQFRELWSIENHQLRVSTSIGVALFPKDGSDEVELMKNADIAMYKAKEMGRDKFSFFTDELNAKVLLDIQLEEDMFDALDKGEFELHYQPKVDIRDNRIIGAEALIRWNHPEYGLLSPDKFIPLAEGNGFIIKLGEWVIREGCNALKRMNNSEKSITHHISVNVSLKQLQSSELYDVIKSALSKMDHSQLILEITESIMADDVDFAIHMLKKIQKLGVKISMDDFGTGYSSLSYLHKLPIDTIKIDKLFVDEIPRDLSDNKILLDTVIAMAKTLDMCVIAEGVEYGYQRDYLKARECFFYQGYLFSKPIPEDEYISLLKTS